jgi:hypothetical protein
MGNSLKMALDNLQRAAWARSRRDMMDMRAAVDALLSSAAATEPDVLDRARRTIAEEHNGVILPVLEDE